MVFQDALALLDISKYGFDLKNTFNQEFTTIHNRVIMYDNNSRLFSY